MSVDFENTNKGGAVDGITYKFNGDGTATVEKQFGEVGKYVKIPREICDKKGIARKVTKICENAFSNCENLEFLEIADGIEEIGEWAFAGCENLKIVQLPNGIKEIKKATFKDCKSLQTVVIPERVTKIEGSAFSRCEELSELALPDALTYIGDSAFDYCGKLKSIYIPSAVAHIGSRAFDHCDALEEIQVDRANLKYSGDGVRLIEKEKNKVLYKCKNKVESNRKVSSKGKKKADESLSFADGKKIKEIVRKDGFMYFLGHDYTAAITDFFDPEKSTKYLKLPGEIDDEDGSTYKVREIYGAVFFYRQELEEVELPEEIEIVGENAFAECRNLKKVTMSDNVKKLEHGVFTGCKKLSEIQLPASLKTLEKDAFFGCDSLKTLTLPEGVEVIGERVFGCCHNLSQVTLPRSLKKISALAFCHCDKLESQYIPAFVEEIDGEAFHGCSSLESLTVDAENNKYYSAGNCVIEKSSGSVVAGCVTSVIPFGVTQIADKAFHGSQIRYLNIPASVTKIGDRAFAWSGLYEIYIPTSVVEIGDGAFDDCYTRLRCGAKSKPDGWSPYIGLREINYTTWNYSVPLDIKPAKKKESIFKKIKNIFANIFGKK